MDYFQNINDASLLNDDEFFLLAKLYINKERPDLFYVNFRNDKVINRKLINYIFHHYYNTDKINYKFVEEFMNYVFTIKNYQKDIYKIDFLIDLFDKFIKSNFYGEDCWYFGKIPDIFFDMYVKKHKFNKSFILYIKYSAYSVQYNLENKYFLTKFLLKNKDDIFFKNNLRYIIEEQPYSKFLYSLYKIGVIRKNFIPFNVWIMYDKIDLFVKMNDNYTENDINNLLRKRCYKKARKLLTKSEKNKELVLKIDYSIIDNNYDLKRFFFIKKLILRNKFNN